MLVIIGDGVDAVSKIFKQQNPSFKLCQKLNFSIIFFQSYSNSTFHAYYIIMHIVVNFLESDFPLFQTHHT